MNHIAYTKQIPPFFQELLSRLNKINIFSINMEHACNPAPHEMVHYQPFKTGINIYTSVIIKLSHELSHMLEVKDNNRLLKFDYGIRKYFPKTNKGQLQAIAREARARGIQTRLVEIAFGNSTLLVHRHCYLYVSPTIKFNESIGRFANGNEVVEWSSAVTQTAYREWSKDRIVHEWNKKAEFINHWLETAGATQSGYEATMQRYLHANQ
jgi:hypothetical protein